MQYYNTTPPPPIIFNLDNAVLSFFTILNLIRSQLSSCSVALLSAELGFSSQEA